MDIPYYSLWFYLLGTEYQPLLSDPCAPFPQPIIPANQKSSPPVYLPALKALLTSACSRTTKPLKAANLVNPPTLPARADPSSPDARIFGPFSKRREVNIRRRYFVSESKKVFLPIELQVRPDFEGKKKSVKKLIPGFGMRIGVFADIEKTVATFKARPLTRRERSSEQDRSEAGIRAGHPSRWLRRRFRSLLNRLPILLYNPSDNPEQSGSFSVQQSELSLPPYQRPIPYLPEVDSTTLAWLNTPVTK